MRRAWWAAISIAWASSAVGAQTSATAILDRIDVNPRRPIDFHALVLPETVYVGQQATYQVAVMLSADARSRLRRNPEFLPPELQGLLAYELGSPTRVAARNYSGGVFEAHVFQRALFPVASGAQVVPAPQLTYALPQSSSYFSREERFVVRAESAAFIVRALPLEGRPDDFNGAVGVLKSSVRLDTTAARVGDPLVLTLRVQGTGNVKLLPRPTIELDWASNVSGSERILVDSSGSLVRGTKEFDWILTPTRDGRVRVPPLRYAYFDPYAARYAVAESAPMELSVRAGALAVSDESESVTLLPLRIPGVAERSVTTWSGSGRPPTRWLWWVVLALLLPLPTWWWSRTGRTSSGQGRDTKNAKQILEGARESEQGARGAARTTRRTLLAAIANRFGLSPQALVSRRQVARLLRRAGVTRETTRDMLAVLERLDELGFASGDRDHGDARADAVRAEADAARTATELLRRIETEAVPRGRQISAPSAIVGLCLVAFAGAVMPAAPVHAQRSSASARAVNNPPVKPTPDDARAAHALARDAYERRAFTEAAQRFQALATRQPRNPDVLTNWGTAAWAAGDTVNAVIAWQRAARLEPLAVDLQERIGMLPAGARGGIADVPMVPVAWLLLGALGLWVTGWSVLSWLAWRRRRTTPTTNPTTSPRADTALSRAIRSLAQVTVVLSVLASAWAWWGMRALDASALSVVLRPETMRLAPGTDADAMGGVSTGDVVRVVESRDAWQRVVHADGRRGWLPIARLIVMQSEATESAADAARVSTPRDVPVRE